MPQAFLPGLLIEGIYVLSLRLHWLHLSYTLGTELTVNSAIAAEVSYFKFSEL